MKYLIFTLFASFVLWNGDRPSDSVDSATSEIMPNDSLMAIWDAHIADIKAELGDRVSLTADEVFGNLKIDMFKTMPVERFLNVMKMGFSRSLGVGCDHCHKTAEWSSDQLTPKQTAREMWDLSFRINNELLKQVSTLADKQVFVNCT
ncbi:MAG: photosynthetic reaction center cytochrome c subunit family protein, partial [Saprospiraceae bacterium]|nr:photosynthetic reaction center cytochrome c subunit family protein [Saprospiraceae bacterium]